LQQGQRIAMFSLATFQKEYEPDRTEVVINGRTYSLFLPKSLDPFIDPQDPLHNFPLWAKVWTASVVLADSLARMTVNPAKRFLEIGAGIGLAGVVAAACGHHITVTDYNTDALRFAEANAALNRCSTMTVAKLNWHQPRGEDRYDTIVGADIVYKKQDYMPLQRLFESRLKPTGEIMLVEQVRKTVFGFQQAMSNRYRVDIEKKTLRNDQEETRLVVFHMTPKPS
jgi:predicted nicotinamide N-methyase